MCVCGSVMPVTSPGLGGEAPYDWSFGRAEASHGRRTARAHLHLQPGLHDERVAVPKCDEMRVHSLVLVLDFLDRFLDFCDWADFGHYLSATWTAKAKATVSPNRRNLETNEDKIPPGNQDGDTNSSVRGRGR